MTAQVVGVEHSLQDLVIAVVLVGLVVVAMVVITAVERLFEITGFLKMLLQRGLLITTERT